VSNVRHHQEAIQKQVAPGANSQLEQLRSALVAKRDSSVQAGHVQDIELINKAIKKLDEESVKLSQTQQVSNLQDKTAQARQAIQATTPIIINEQAASNIKAIRSVPGIVLKSGQRFASIDGREPSNTSYMKTNIKGLWALVNTKNS
jgi:hypothetical protein